VLTLALLPSSSVLQDARVFVYTVHARRHTADANSTRIPRDNGRESANKSCGPLVRSDRCTERDESRSAEMRSVSLTEKRKQYFADFTPEDEPSGVEKWRIRK